MTNTPSSNTQQPSPKRLKPLLYRKRLWLTLFILVISVAHPVWLAWVSALLVYDKPATAPEIIIPLSSRTSLQAAKSLLEANPQLACHILLEPLNRLHKLDIIKLPIEQTKIELQESGINPDTIQFHVPPDDTSPDEDRYHQVANQLKHILQEQPPDTTIELIIPAHMTRRIFWHLSKYLDRETLNRLSIKGVPPQDFDLVHWWKTRHGIRCVVGEYLLLANLLIAQKNEAKHICTQADFQAAAIVSAKSD